MRLALITNMPPPYRLPVWESLAHKAEALQVFLCSESEPNRIWKPESGEAYSFTQTKLPGMHWFIQKMDWGLHFNPTLWRELKRFRPDHILTSGYESPSYLLALLYAKVNRLPITLWWLSHAFSSRVPRGPIVWAKRRLFALFDSFCAASTPSKEYLTEVMRIPESKIACAINTVDVQRWHAAVQEYRNGHGSADALAHFLYIGQFIDRKGVMELLTAFRSIPADMGHLRLVGYGPQESRIRSYISRHKMENVDIADPTRTIEETARHYAWSDILVMPSLSEVWGLVVNEALASGVNVLASKHAGATYDLIEQAPTDVGASFEPADQVNFARALRLAVEKRAAFDRQAIISWGLRHTPEAYGDCIWKSLTIAPSRNESA